MTQFRKCKTCFYWDRQSSKYGKCSKIGRKANLRFAYEEGVVFAMTPKFGVCDDHTTDEEAKDKIKN